MNDNRFNQEDLQAYIKLFEMAVLAEDGYHFSSFDDSEYLTESEHFKHERYQEAHYVCKQLCKDEIGTGEILRKVGEQLRKAQPLVDYRNIDTFINAPNKTEIERALYHLYRERDDERAYEELRSLGCGKYDILAALAFFKNKDYYLPIHPKKMQNNFALIGYDVKLARHTDWQSYQTNYIDAIREIRQSLIDHFNIRNESDISLLDAHSFVWLLDQYEEKAKPVVHEYIPNYESMHKSALVAVRVGQSEYRKRLIERWGGKCSVTGCSNLSVLNASHIKPFSKCDPKTGECWDADNGLLLIPNLDRAFDRGLISFNDDGSLLISPQLSRKDANILGIDSGTTKIIQMNDKTREYLAYHRSYVFQG